MFPSFHFCLYEKGKSFSTQSLIGLIAHIKPRETEECWLVVRTMCSPVLSCSGNRLGVVCPRAVVANTELNRVQAQRDNFNMKFIGCPLLLLPRGLLSQGLYEQWISCGFPGLSPHSIFLLLSAPISLTPCLI